MSTRTDDTEFMDELAAATRLRPHMASNIMLLSIAGLIAFFIIWASFSEIEELTRGSGQVVPSREVQVVQSLEGGVLAELLVAEGDRVEAGQVLMRISDVQFAAEERGIEARLWSLSAKRARLLAEAQGTALVLPPEIAENAPDIVANERALYESRQQERRNAVAILESRIDQINAEIAETNAETVRLRQNRASLNEELTITAEMVRQRAVPRLEEIRLRREISDVDGKLNVNAEKLPGLQAQLRATENERADLDDKFRTQALGELNEVETELQQLRESIASAGDRVFRTELRAPVDGIVNNIALKTVGGVVEPAQRLIEIVPVDDELKIIARVRPSDIAFLRPGQDVMVKITAYDPQRYGSLNGALVRIGANSVTDRDGNVFFEIEVRTDKNYLGEDDHPLPITPGMVAETEVITGQRTIMEYLTKPIVRARDRALTER